MKSLRPDNVEERVIAVEIQKVEAENSMSRIVIPKELTKRLEDERKFALVGKFIGLEPNIDLIRNWVQVKWSRERDVDIIELPCNFLLFNFLLEDDMSRVLECGPWYFESKRLFLKRWTRGFRPEKENINISAIWVILPHLPIEFWCIEVIEVIASTIGNLIVVDPTTRMQTRMMDARFCVNTDLSKKLPNRISLENEDGEWVQIIAYENMSQECCKQLEHHSKDCSERKHNQMGKEKEGWSVVGKTKNQEKNTITDQVEEKGSLQEIEGDEDKQNENYKQEDALNQVPETQSAQAELPIQTSELKFGIMDNSEAKLQQVEQNSSQEEEEEEDEAEANIENLKQQQNKEIKIEHVKQNSSKEEEEEREEKEEEEIEEEEETKEEEDEAKFNTLNLSLKNGEQAKIRDNQLIAKLFLRENSEMKHKENASQAKPQRQEDLETKTIENDPQPKPQPQKFYYTEEELLLRGFFADEVKIYQKWYKNHQVFWRSMFQKMAIRKQKMELAKKLELARCPECQRRNTRLKNIEE